MIKSNRGWRVVAVALLILVAIVVAWPAAFVAVHGWNPSGWPADGGMATPPQWAALLNHFDVVKIAFAYWKMAIGTSSAFADGGTVEIKVMATLTALWCVALILGGKSGPLRDPSGVYGKVDWASKSELKRMKAGLELGINPYTDRPVRVQVEGNLVTIAPPRSGKTGGFIIPNLAFPEPNAWSGPARRRRSEGRRLPCCAAATDRHGQDHPLPGSPQSCWRRRPLESARPRRS